MTGHTKWRSLRKQHDDLEINKQEVFRFGDWSIYDASRIVTGSSPKEQWSSFILHCRTWKEWERVARPPANTWIKNESVDASDNHYLIEVTKRCNTNMTAETINRCPKCHAMIPDEVVALWKLQNFDKIQEFHSV